MEKMAPNSKFIGHSTKIIWQSKIKGPLSSICWIAGPASDPRQELSSEKEESYNWCTRISLEYPLLVKVLIFP